jgi:hypothetical protein
MLAALGRRAHDSGSQRYEAATWRPVTMSRRASLIAATVIVLAVPYAHASHTSPDTLLLFNSLPSFPAIALDPVTGDRHFAYQVSGVLQHHWESGATWQTESIVDSVSPSTGFRLRIAPDGRPVAVYQRKGRLVCAVRETGGWDRDTLDVLTGTQFPVSLALHPTSGEPSVAWVRPTTTPGVPSQVFYARRSGSTWTTTQVDTTSSAALYTALGIDGTGMPHLAWSRPRGEGPQGLVAGVGAGPDGPFVPATVDSQAYAHVTLAMDRSTDEPRILYVANATPGGFSPRIRYAYRVPGGAWEWTHVANHGTFGSQPGPGLAVDPAGNPIVSYTIQAPIEPVLSDPEPNEVASCGGAFTDYVVVYHRTGGAGGGAFTYEFLDINSNSGVLAIASGAVGHAHVVFRDLIDCPPYGLTTIGVTVPPTVGVDPMPDGTLAWSIANPARAGDAVHAMFRLDHDAEVLLTLHDLTGRRVASRRGLFAAGSQHLTWAVPDLAPGLYWLTVRADHQAIGSRALVILK